MRQTPWHTTLAKLAAATAVVAGAMTGLTGCGNGGPDQQVHQTLTQARVETAAGGEEALRNAQKSVETASARTDASDVVQAQAKSVLGQLHYESALDGIRELDRHEIDASRLALEVVELGRQIDLSSVLVDGYKQMDPQKVRQDIEQKIADAKGGPDKVQWLPQQGKSSVPTLSAVQQQISNLEGQIAQKQAQAKQLEQQRVALVEDSDKLSRQSEQAKGRQSVDLFKQASDARRRASDLSTQIETVNASVVPLQSELSVAQGQQQVLNGYIAELGEQSKTLDAGWQAVQKEIQAQLALAQQIATTDALTAAATTQPAGGAAGGAEGATSAPAGGGASGGGEEHFAGRSMVAKAKALAAANAQVDAVAKTVADDLENAAKAFNQAFATANTAQQALMEKVSSPNNALKASEAAFKIQQQVIWQQQYALAEARAQRVLGSVLAGRAANLATRVKVYDLLAPAMQKAGVPVPAELQPGDAKAQFDTTVKAADAAYDTAEKRLLDVTGATAPGNPGDLPPEIQKSAQVALIFVRYGRSQLATLAGDAQAAQKYASDARDQVKVAYDAQAALPALPGDLSSAIPAPVSPSTQSATPTSGPATAPAGAEPAATAPAATGTEPAATPPAATPPGGTPPAPTPPAGGTPPPAGGGTPPVGGGPG